MSTTETVTQQRKSWHKRLGKYFKKITIGNSRPARGRQTTQRYEGDFHYVISAEQEDEIRESFLVEKLRSYTQTLSESDVEGLEDSNEQPTGADEEDAFNGLICVPIAGQCRDDDHDDNVEPTSRRQIPNGCAVCLCPFEANDRVTWSSNKECNHVFHEACILDWLNSSGRRHLHRRRRDDQREGVLNYANDPLRKITRFPMPCPCCRQLFVVCPEATVDDLNEAVLPSSTDSSTSDESMEGNTQQDDDNEQQTETPANQENTPSMNSHRTGNLSSPAMNMSVMTMEVSA